MVDPILRQKLVGVLDQRGHLTKYILVEFNSTETYIRISYLDINRRILGKPREIYTGVTVDNISTIEVKEVGQTAPSIFALYQNYPNPFNPQTEISYYLPYESYTRLNIFNLRGQQIITLVDEDKKNGLHKIQWNGLNETGEQVSSGLYYYQLETDSYITNKKMILLR